ncbi:MAG: hypothetical protein J6Y48_03980 [Clostridia bacterium]|nr:hypothetical protein [Clostridia bacterium]
MSHIRRRPAIGSVRAESGYPDYLAHYGIFGQKWGVRRYQNEDGTLTEEGKKRYNKPESENWKKSDAEHLSDEELNRRNSRLQRERQYRDLTTSEVERERNQFKKDLLKKALIIPVTAAVAILGKYYITKHADQIPGLINKFKNVAVSKVNRSIQGGKLLTNSAKRYAGSAGNKISRLYNYRPRINNAIPRMRNWPKVW